jgi:hypothetical protein
MIRLLLPSILGTFFFLISIWTIYGVLKSTSTLDENAKSEIFGMFKKFLYVITILVSIAFTFYVINISSVNEIPRSTIQDSTEEGKTNFENGLTKDTISKKTVTDTITKQ